MHYLSIIFLSSALALSQYEQCGGMSSSCGSSTKPCIDSVWSDPCPNGFHCSRQNAYYWQCIPNQEIGQASNSCSKPTGDSVPANAPAPTPEQNAPVNNPSLVNNQTESNEIQVLQNEYQIGKTTRYWDCCKPSCSWPGKALVTNPVKTCSKDGNPLNNPNAVSGCENGEAFGCSTQTPFMINETFAYGFAAVKLSGKTEADTCCACYELKFTSGPIVGKTMVVQSTNTGGDLGANHFDLALPGGGVGIFDGCGKQFDKFQGGERYGGLKSLEECKNLPPSLQPGCEFRFGWFKGADNPDIQFRPVKCPAQLIAITGCVRV